MKIGIFAYNFNHWKTQVGIQNLILNGFKPELILAADPVKLNFPQSEIRITPKDLYLQHPKDIASIHGIDYKVCIHNSTKAEELIKDYNLDVGVILGSRILKPISINPFNIGVLNMHPGILPMNRGLDNIKWAILDDLPQGVSTHLIDSKIDRGNLIEQESIKIYKDDTLLDIHLRVQNLEQKLMVSSLNKIKEGNLVTRPLGEGKYYKAVPKEKESTLYNSFKLYKEKYGVK